MHFVNSDYFRQKKNTKSKNQTIKTKTKIKNQNEKT